MVVLMVMALPIPVVMMFVMMLSHFLNVA